MDTKKIGLFLQGLRKQKNMTQLELANQLNVAHQTVSKWENGDSLPDIITLQQIAKYYQITIEEILQGEANMPVIRISETLKNNQTRMIIRLSSTLLILISLFLFYVSESARYGDYFPVGDFDPFNLKDEMIILNYRGVHLVFKAIELTLITGGAWLIFLASFLLTTLFSITFVSVYKHHHFFTYIKENTYLRTKKITEIILFIGFILILIAAIFNKDISLNIGYYIGFLSTIGLFVINYLEKKHSKVNNNTPVDEPMYY